MNNPRTRPTLAQDPCLDEGALRRQLAEFYHLVDYLGWSELIFNHISVRIPGAVHHYLVNPFGLTYDEVTPENLLKVNLAGQLVEPSPYPANPAAFALHGAIHGARSDIHCVAHTHTTAVSAVALKSNGLGHDDFYGAQLFGDIAYHTFEGITLFKDEKQRIIESLGDRHILILRNHGVAVCERDVSRTFIRLWTTHRAAEIQCQAAMLPGPNIVLSDDVRGRCANLIEQLTNDDGFAVKLFDAMVRKMQRGSEGRSVR
jgi:ribulose-5-phosphate 4-epimerase/fuculose-1-phosphate aldolase